MVQRTSTKLRKRTVPLSDGLQSRLSTSLYQRTTSTDFSSSLATLSTRRPDNPIHWIESPGFLHGSDDLIPGERFLYPKSHNIIRDVFGLLCPWCNEEISSDVLQELDVRDREILLKDGSCPKCCATQAQIVKARRDPYYQQVALAVGMRAGKTYLASNCASWILYQCLQGKINLRRAFGLSPGPPIEMAFVASSSTQTKDTIWASFIGLFESSPWFQSYVDRVRRIESETGQKLLNITSSRIEFKEIGLNCVSHNSNSGALAGRTRIAVFLDELARFQATDGRSSADEVYRALQRSMKTLWTQADDMIRHGLTPPIHPLLFAISSPMHDEDRIMRLLRDSQDYPKLRIYSRHLPSWEMNPTFTYDHFEAELEADPIGAQRDFAAKPVGVHERLFTDESILENSVTDADRQPILKYETERYEENGFSYVAPKLISCWGDKITPRYVHMDAGWSGDSFGMSIVHVEGRMPEYTVVVDAVIEVRPEKALKGSFNARREVNFPRVLDFIVELRKFITIEMISFDRWQQIFYVQKLRTLGYHVDQHNIQVIDYERFATDMMSHRIRMLPKEVNRYDPKLTDIPVTKAFHELKMLERVSATRIDHPDGGSSDVAICVVGAHRNATKDFFDAGSTRSRTAQMPRNRGMHISQLKHTPDHERVGGVFRFGR